MFKKFIFWNYKETPEYIEAEALKAKIVDKCLDKLTIDLVSHSFVIGMICFAIVNVICDLVDNSRSTMANSQIPPCCFCSFFI